VPQCLWQCTRTPPKGSPKPLGKAVTTIIYTDANLFHDILTGRSVTGILHLCNQTLIDWYIKRQETVETETFGSEFKAAQITVDQIIDLKQHFNILGFQFNIEAIFSDIIRQYS
jgi:hypothetical protein